jgi:hypothetical protein
MNKAGNSDHNDDQAALVDSHALSPGLLPSLLRTHPTHSQSRDTEVVPWDQAF